MEARLQRRVQRYGWDKASQYYEQYWSRQLAPAQDRLLEMAALQPGEQVVDIACGTGLVSFPAADAVGSDGVLVGTDLSDQMIEQVRGKAADALRRTSVSPKKRAGHTGRPSPGTATGDLGDAEGYAARRG